MQDGSSALGKWNESAASQVPAARDSVMTAERPDPVAVQLVVATVMAVMEAALVVANSPEYDSRFCVVSPDRVA